MTGVLAKVKDVIFIFVPIHAGVRCTERAYKLAGLATIDDDQPMDRTDTVNALRELGRAEDFERGGLTSLSQIYEMRVKSDIAKG